MKAFIVVILVIILIYLFLIAPRMFHRVERKPFLGWKYAHRGLFHNGTEAPENSLPAICKAVEAGYGIEFDVQLSKDNQPVVFHDASLKRMCGVEGKVWDHNLEELRKFRLADSEAQIPTLEEVLKAVDGKVPLIIEYKLDRVQTKVCELADQLLQRYNGPYCVESFHPLALIWYRKNRSDVMRGQLSEELFRTPKYKSNVVYYLLSYLLTNVAARPDFIAYNHHHADNISRRICRSMGALSVAYTVKSQAEYEQVRDKFDLFIFDSFLL